MHATSLGHALSESAGSCCDAISFKWSQEFCRPAHSLGATAVLVGDVLIDDLGKPTSVRSTCEGLKNMYDIIPDKNNFPTLKFTFEIGLPCNLV